MDDSFILHEYVCKRRVGMTLAEQEVRKNDRKLQDSLLRLKQMQSSREELVRVKVPWSKSDEGS
jgi:hypothetical protein